MEKEEFFGRPYTGAKALIEILILSVVLAIVIAAGLALAGYGYETQSMIGHEEARRYMANVIAGIPNEPRHSQDTSTYSLMIATGVMIAGSGLLCFLVPLMLLYKAIRRKPWLNYVIDDKGVTCTPGPDTPGWDTWTLSPKTPTLYGWDRITGLQPATNPLHIGLVYRLSGAQTGETHLLAFPVNGTLRSKSGATLADRIAFHIAQRAAS